jgi:hypothetical protein
LETTLKTENIIHEEIKIRLNLGNACSHLVQNLQPSYLLSKNARIKIYKTIGFPAVFVGVKLGLSH